MSLASLCVLAGVAGLSACTARLPASDVRAPSAAVKVLVVTHPDAGYVKALTEALNADAALNSGRRAVQVDVVEVTSVGETTASIRRLGSAVNDYSVVVTQSQTYARAVQLQVQAVPIVFSGVDDPVKRCLVDSVIRPGRNASGYMHHLHSGDAKRLQVLRDAFPQLKQANVLVDAGNLAAKSCDPADPYWLGSRDKEQAPCAAGERPVDDYLNGLIPANELLAAGAALGLRLNFILVCRSADLQTVAHEFRSRADIGWVVPWHGLFAENRAAVVDALRSAGGPAIYPDRRYADMGGLMSLGMLRDTTPDRPQFLAVKQVLAGRDPATVPVQSPRGFSLVVNARTADALSTKPSAHVMRIADEVIH